MSDFTYFLIAVFFNHWKALGIILLMLIFAGSIEAGPYMDFDLGVNITDYDGNDAGFELLSDDNPVAIVRAGYETGVYHHSGGLNISGHAYYEHMSSLIGTDSGIDVLMIGVRLGI